MAEIEHDLRIKYGLERNPNESQIQRWLSETRRKIQQGMDAEAAGLEAAKEIFPDCGKMLFKAEADTIESLLDKAKRR